MKNFEAFLEFIKELKKDGYCSAKVKGVSDSALEIQITVEKGGLPEDVTIESVRKTLELL